jgi:hypothetical protein
MNSESKIYELYYMIFNEEPDSDTLKSLLIIFHEHNDSIDYLEANLRNSHKFKILSKKLEVELEIAELYYILLNRKPDNEGLDFFKNQVIVNKKSLDWVKESILGSEEYKNK